MTQFNHQNGQYLQIGDARIYYETAGNPDGEPLLLLHGGLGTLAGFQDIPDKLPDSFRFIGIDLRGHGKSTKGSSHLSYARYLSDIELVLASLNITSVSILGISDGGIVGYRMATNNPSMVKKLITVGSQWRLLDNDPSLPILKNVTSEMWREMFPDSVDYYERINPKPDFHTLVKSVVEVWTDTQPSGYPNEAVNIIQAPVLIVRGDEDQLLSLSEAVELRNRIEKAVFLNIPFAGHEAHKDSPEIFAEAATLFLAQD